jgi:hypothetical protein
MKRRPISLSSEARRWLLAGAGLGAAAFAAGLALTPGRAWSAYLTSAFYFLTVALGGLAWLALFHVAKAGWSVVVKRVAEGLTAYLPVGAASMILVLLGLRSLYHWAGHHTAHDPALHAKAAYLNAPSFAIRMIVALSIWLVFAALLRRSSIAQDGDGSAAHTRRSVALSAGFLLVFAWTFSMASFDWIMSLEPHWASTVFAFYNIAGVLVAGLAATAIVAIALRRAGSLPEVNESHLHDLGKLMFGLSTFWAYLWLSQYLLIWYANIPEETAYYLARTERGWGFLFYLNLILNWGIPFLALLPRPAKRSETSLLRVAGLLLLGRWLDVYLMVTPSAQPEHAGVGAIDALVFLGFASIFLLVVTRALRSRPVVARGDPYLVESLHHHQ